MNTQTAMLTGEAALLTCRLRALSKLRACPDQVLKAQARAGSPRALPLPQVFGTSNRLCCNDPRLRSYPDLKEACVRSPLLQRPSVQQRPALTAQVTISASDTFQQEHSGVEAASANTYMLGAARESLRAA